MLDALTKEAVVAVLYDEGEVEIELLILSVFDRRMLGEIVGGRRISTRDSAASQEDVRKDVRGLGICRKLMKTSDFMMPCRSQNFRMRLRTGAPRAPHSAAEFAVHALTAQNVDRCKGHLGRHDAVDASFEYIESPSSSLVT